MHPPDLQSFALQDLGRRPQVRAGVRGPFGLARGRLFIRASVLGQARVLEVEAERVRHSAAGKALSPA